MSSDLILISRAIQKRMDQKDSVSLQDIKRVVQIIGDFVYLDAANDAPEEQLTVLRLLGIGKNLHPDYREKSEGFH